MSELNLYHRPLVQHGTERPEGAIALTGGPLWFTHVEVLSRDAAPRIIAAIDAPQEVLERLSAPRADIAGLDMGRVNVMGILNVTPDSFSDGGKFERPDAAIAHALSMVTAGADILDVGGESTRPGAAYVDPADEVARTAPVIAAIRQASIGQASIHQASIHQASVVPISIDTRKASVAEAALAAGATLVNDVYAFTHDPDLARVTAAAGAPVCLMHAQGDPEVMQDNPDYADVLLDVYDFLQERVDAAVSAGIARDQIMIDPGIGFGKTVDHNLQIMNRISLFHSLGCPILLGASRKRFIGTIGDEPEAAERLGGSIAVALAGAAQGVQIIRVHDIKQTKQALDLWQAMSSGEYRDVS